MDSVDKGFITRGRVEQLRQFVHIKYKHVCDLKNKHL